MANPDRPNGFTPVKTLSGAPVSAVIRAIGVADGEDIFIGDMVNLESGLADPMATNDAAILGAVVGVGKIVNGKFVGAFDPSNLNPGVYYDDSASTHTDYCVFYAPATDCIFEVQSNADLDLVVGSPCDLVDGVGSTTSGRSIQEVGSNTNSDFVVVEIPQYPDNDSTLANTRYWVRVTRAEQAFG
jgi:hypothetical protein